MTMKDSLDQLWKIHSYTNEYIRFADQKAAFLFAIPSALLAAMYSFGYNKNLGFDRLTLLNATFYDTALGTLTLLSIAPLALCAVFSLCVIAPRLGRLPRTFLSVFSKPTSSTKHIGHIYWGDIIAHGTSTNYAAGMENRIADDLSRDVATHVYTLAQVAASKYKT